MLLYARQRRDSMVLQVSSAAIAQGNRTRCSHCHAESAYRVRCDGRRARHRDASPANEGERLAGVVVDDLPRLAVSCQAIAGPARQ